MDFSFKLEPQSQVRPGVYYKREGVSHSPIVLWGVAQPCKLTPVTLIIFYDYDSETIRAFQTTTLFN